MWVKEKFHLPLSLWHRMREAPQQICLHIRREKVQFGKLRSLFGEGKSQRCRRFAAIQEVPLGKGRDIPCLKKLVPGDWVCWMGTSPRKMQKTFTPETIGFCLLEQSVDCLEPFWILPSTKSWRRCQHSIRKPCVGLSPLAAGPHAHTQQLPLCSVETFRSSAVTHPND